jgi:hypothetical protein
MEFAPQRIAFDCGRKHVHFPELCKAWRPPVLRRRHMHLRLPASEVP